MSLLGGALGSVVGGLFGLAGSKMQANSAASQAELQARLQRENWEYAQKNAHQFEIQDLKAAGLNPILSATHSQLASMPSVSASSTMDNPFKDMSALINSALQRQQEKDLKKEDLEIEKLKLENENLKTRIQWNATENQKSYWEGLLKQGEATTASQVALNEAKINELNNNISIGWSRLESDLKDAESKREVDKHTMYLIDNQAMKAISESNLTNTQREDLIRNWNSWMTKVENLTAKQRYDAFKTEGVEWAHKLSIPVNLLNPFGSVSFGKSGARVGNHRP